MTIEVLPGMEMSALDWWDDIAERLRETSPVIFLDYDGTLTPISDVPSQPVLSDSMRGTLRRLAKLCPVVLVSGRELADIKRRVGLDELVYMASGGFEVIGPYGHYVERSAEEFVPSLDRAEKELRYSIGEIRGALVERRRFAVAVHHRLVDERTMPWLEEIFDRVARKNPKLRAVKSKRAFELKPNADWDRGRAVGLVISTLRLRNAMPVYIGDDNADEEAFKAIGEHGVTIMVTEDARETAAQYVLADELEVQQFLEQVIETLEERAP